MKNFIFLGPPGCGKGTQAEILCLKYNYLKISTGELLRKYSTDDLNLAKTISNILSEGGLVPDEIVAQIITDFYSGIEAVPAVILDGFPRTVNQAILLEQTLALYQMNVDQVFLFNVPDDILVKRITGRFSCSVCGAIYNKFFKQTLVEEKCDKCQSNIFISRSDDSEEIIINRLKTYHASLATLTQFYGDLIVEIDADKPLEIITDQIVSYL